MDKLAAFLWTGALSLLLGAGCPAGGQPAEFEGASITGATLNEQAAGERMVFGVTVAKAGDPVGVDLRGSVSAARVSKPRARKRPSPPGSQPRRGFAAFQPDGFQPRAFLRPT